MYYQTFSLILILLTVSFVWTPQLLVAQMSPSSKEKLNADLLEAAKNGQTGKVLALIKAGADVNAKDIDGKTALMWAVANGHIETANLLRAAGAKDNP
jgi:ankyrin repeat protein